MQEKKKKTSTLLWKNKHSTLTLVSNVDERRQIFQLKWTVSAYTSGIRNTTLAWHPYHFIRLNHIMQKAKEKHSWAQQIEVIARILYTFYEYNNNS